MKSIYLVLVVITASLIAGCVPPTTFKAPPGARIMVDGQLVGITGNKGDKPVTAVLRPDKVHTVIATLGENNVTNYLDKPITRRATGNAAMLGIMTGVAVGVGDPGAGGAIASGGLYLTRYPTNVDFVFNTNNTNISSH